jgi:hypothetical protein
LGAAESAIMASRGALRMPLPTRSAKRTAKTCGQLVAKPNSGRTMPASA